MEGHHPGAVNAHLLWSHQPWSAVSAGVGLPAGHFSLRIAETAALSQHPLQSTAFVRTISSAAPGYASWLSAAVASDTGFGSISQAGFARSALFG